MRQTGRGRKFGLWFERTAINITKATESSVAFLPALLVIIGCVVTAPLLGFSNTGQLVINTGTTLVTFLMVFVIQQSQNKESLAIQLKLNEPIAAEERAGNRLIAVEDLSQAEPETLKKFYVKLSQLAREGTDLHSFHSVDEATDVHKHKKHLRQRKEQSIR